MYNHRLGAVNIQPSKSGNEITKGQHDRSFSLPGCLSLFHKCLHTLFLVLGSKEQIESTPFICQPITQEGFKGMVDCFFSKTYSQWGTGGNFSCKLQCFIQVAINRNDPGDQAKIAGFC